MALAIFDLDNTLLAGDSDHAWGQFLVDEGLVDAQLFKEKNDYYYLQYQEGSLNIREYLEFALQPLTQMPLEQLHALRERFVNDIIRPLIPQAAWDILQEHRNKGDYLLIITATNRFVTEPIAQLLEVDDLIATDPEMIDGQYTGKVAGVPSFQAGKVTRLEAWLEEKQVSLAGSYFYSDSHNDLPLLDQVDHPVAVDADEALTAAALANQWPIISLRN